MKKKDAAAAKRKKSSKKNTTPTYDDQIIMFHKLYLEKCKERKQIPNHCTLSMLTHVISETLQLNKIFMDFSCYDLSKMKPVPLCGLTPLVNALLVSRCYCVTSICMNKAPLADEEVTDLIIILQHQKFILSTLELTHCCISSDAVKRIARSMATNRIKSLCFDFTELGEENCQMLCDGLTNNITVSKLSMRHCNLNSACGRLIGNLLMCSVISILHLDGNHLGSEGISELIKLAADFAEMETLQRKQERTVDVDSDGLGKGKTTLYESTTPIGKMGKLSGAKSSSRKKSAKVAPEEPKLGPYLTVLSIDNNDISPSGIESEHSPIAAMQLLGKWITYSAHLKSVSLNGNRIGNLGGRELLGALKTRKEAGLKSVRLTVSPYMNSETFSKILTLGSGKEGKKKGKKKKKKK